MRQHLANVHLSGLHNLERDYQKSAVLLQTSIKKAQMSDKPLFGKFFFTFDELKQSS